jgi:hypothetical protein
MVRSADSPARLRLVASAVAGRPLEVAAAEPGTPAWTDGATVYVDVSRPAVAQLRSLAVQAALVGAGSLERDVLGPAIRRPSVARRYLAVEGHRALAQRRAVLPPVVWPLVDDDLARRCDSPTASTALAMSGAPVADPPADFGAIHPRRISAESPQSDAVATPGHRPRRAAASVAVRPLDDEDAEVPVSDLFSSPVGGGGLGRLLRRLFGEGRSPAAGAPGADGATRVSRRAGGVAPRLFVSTAVAAVPDVAAGPAPAAFHYPEWDGAHRRYRPDWCTVTEAEPDELAPLARPDTHRLRRALTRLGTELERRHRRPQGDDIDVDAAVEARVALAAGSTPDEGVYIDTLRSRRELSVLVLLDVSGSAGLPAGSGTTVHGHQVAAAAALCLALSELGDRVALYGFRSQGRSAVQLSVVKRFEDQSGSLALARLGGFVPGAYTRLGAAVRHGAAVLERDGGTARRLLVVVSDGLAYDHGYEAAYGEADARRALAEARRRGTGCLCLSVGAASDAEALRRVFGSAAYASLPAVEQLPAVVGPLLRAALASAELRRTAWQRRTRSAERRIVERRTA